MLVTESHQHYYHVIGHDYFGIANYTQTVGSLPIYIQNAEIRLRLNSPDSSWFIPWLYYDVDTNAERWGNLNNLCPF